MDVDHDTQRELEQRALRNVSWLAQKLGYADVIDARREKMMIAGIGIAVVVVIAILVAVAMLRDTSGSDLERHRCEVDVRATMTNEVRAKVYKDNPDMSDRKREDMVDKTVHDMAASKCAGGSAKQ